MKRLIITGDDFGLSVRVNEAIEHAHVHGVLSATSLMVAEPGVQDAVARAKRLPGLRVGLHLSLVNGRSLSDPRNIPHLVTSEGLLPTDQVRAGFQFAFSPAARRELALEIEAQFNAFAQTGLALDHVNGHCHMHLHPVVFDLILKIGPRYGMKALRVVREPAAAALSPAALLERCVVAPLDASMRRKLKRAGIAFNDRLFGLALTGRMNAEAMLGFLQNLPDGLSEIYCHPGAGTGQGPDSETAALIDPRVVALCRDALKPVGFADATDLAA